MKRYNTFVITVDVLPTTEGMAVNYSTLVQAQYLVHDHNGDIDNNDDIEEQHTSARTISSQTTDQENQKEINRKKAFESVIKIVKNNYK